MRISDAARKTYGLPATVTSRLREGWRITSLEVRCIFTLIAAGIIAWPLGADTDSTEILLTDLSYRLLLLAVLIPCVSIAARRPVLPRVLHASIAVFLALVTIASPIAVVLSGNLRDSLARHDAEWAGMEVAAMVRQAVDDGQENRNYMFIPSSEMRVRTDGTDIEVVISSISRESCELMRHSLPNQVLRLVRGTTLVTGIAHLSSVRIAGTDVRGDDYAKACNSFGTKTLPDSAIVARYTVSDPSLKSGD